MGLIRQVGRAVTTAFKQHREVGKIRRALKARPKIHRKAVQKLAAQKQQLHGAQRRSRIYGRTLAGVGAVGAVAGGGAYAGHQSARRQTVMSAGLGEQRRRPRFRRTV